MKYTIAALPTRYAGVNFRSRLEARWAALFDLCKWTWAYEPIDLHGWIPDFVVGDFASGCYVEVKPIDFASNYSVAEDAELMHARDQVPTTSRGFLILGLRPIAKDDLPGLVRIGPVFEHCNCRQWKDVPGLNRMLMPVVSRHLQTGQFDFAVGSGPHPGLMTGEDFESHDEFAGKEFMALWTEAGNIVQWKPRGGG